MVEVPIRRRSARIGDISEKDHRMEKSAHDKVDETADFVHEGIDRAGETADRVRRRVEPVIDRAREVVQPAKERIEREVIEPAAESAREATRVVKEKVSGLREKAFRVVDETAHRFEQDGREARYSLTRFMDFCIGTMTFPIRWAWNTNKRIWLMLPPTLGLILGVLTVLTISWLVFVPLIFESEDSHSNFGSQYEGYTPTGSKLRDWKDRLKETLRSRYSEYEPGGPEDSYGWDILDKSKKNKIMRYVEHLHVDSSYRIPLEMRRLRENMLGAGGIIRWPYNRILNIGNALGRRWNHMLIDAKYGLINAWNTVGYYVFFPFRAIEHTAERGWERMKERAGDVSERMSDRFSNAKHRIDQTFRRHPIREYERYGRGEQERPFFGSRDRYYYYDRHPSEKPYYDRRFRREETFPDKAQDILLGGRDYLQEKAGDALEWAKEKTETILDWSKEKLPKDLTEFGDIIQESVGDMDQQYQSIKKKTMAEIHDLQGKIQHQKQERRGGVLEWMTGWFW